jgi:TPP-dependent pyruvate/acetoin dehydrogenase alpha subunit
MQYSETLLERLYRTMVRIRTCEEALVEPILRGQIRCPCHLYSGQEAIAAGVCACLSDEDYIFGGHRSHGHFLAKGGSMKEMVAEIYTKETGCSKGRGGSMHLIDPAHGMLGSAPIVAGTIALAVGAALAASIRKERRVAVSFFGDGATGEGALYESLNLASLRRLPVLFVCENNLYSTHMPIRDCRVDPDTFKTALAFCMPSEQVDGNDVLQVYRAAQAAVSRCRDGQGPTFLECLTYRQRGHVGPDDNIQGSHTDIRPKEEIAEWLTKDPIPRFEAYLAERRLLSAEALAAIRKEAEVEVAEAVAYAQQSAKPDPQSLMNYVFNSDTLV